MMASGGIFALIGLACLLATLMALRPGWLLGPRRAGCDRGRPAIEIVLPPDPRIAIMAWRRGAKEEVIERLLGGGLSLLGAAERFRRLNAHPPGVEDVSWTWTPGRDEGERHCRQVIAWAELELRDRYGGDEADARLARLEKELADHIAARGGVELPAGE
jgi:hypothetical protein